MDQPSIHTNILIRSNDITGDGNFTQGCKFSPDGLCVLTSTAADNILRLYNTPVDTELLQQDQRESSQHLLEKTIDSSWKSILSIQGGDSVRSYCWYPLMNSHQPATCAFVASCRDQPIHLLDAYNGSIRATYSPHNALDEMESPTVLTFTPDGSKIFATGFQTDRTIHKFDTLRPGRDSDILRLGKTRRSKDGQKGKISSLCFPQQGNSMFSSRNVFAVGTYSPGSIYVYDDRMSNGDPAGVVLHGGVSVMGHGKKFTTRKRRFEDVSSKIIDGNQERDVEEDYQDIFSLAKVRWYQKRVQTGVTQLMWSKTSSGGSGDDGTGAGGGQNDYWLYSASRRSDAVVAFDLRMLSGDTSHPIRGVASFPRDSDTNQRLEFDLDQDGRRLFVASQDCSVKVYDTLTQRLLHTLDGFHDAVNGVSFSNHCGKSLLAVASGARRFDDRDDNDSYSTCLSQEMNDKELPYNPPGCLSLYNISP